MSRPSSPGSASEDPYERARLEPSDMLACLSCSPHDLLLAPGPRFRRLGRRLSPLGPAIRSVQWSDSSGRQPGFPGKAPEPPVLPLSDGSQSKARRLTQANQPRSPRAIESFRTGVNHRLTEAGNRGPEAARGPSRGRGIPHAPAASGGIRPRAKTRPSWSPWDPPHEGQLKKHRQSSTFREYGAQGAAQPRDPVRAWKSHVHR